MKIQCLNILCLLALMASIVSCDSSPRVIEAEAAPLSQKVNSTPTLDKLSTSTAAPAAEHEVVVEEVLNTEKYSYLKVKEEGNSFWVAISKREVMIGETYFYKGGLLKKNFFSREFDRVFETVYLVSNIWQKKKDNAGSALAEAAANIFGGEPAPDLTVGEITLTEGAVQLSALFSNKQKYDKQLIKITGKCVKVNPMIMNRNWLHIQDGAGEGLDLTVTTTESIPLGAIVSLEGTIALDKDFGAGYRYDIIMEGAVVK